MPRVMPKPKFKDDEIAICWQSFAGEGLPGLGVIARGTRLRGDSFAVRTFPWYFVPDGLPEGEWPVPELPEQPEPETLLPPPPPPIPDEEAAIATANLSFGLGGPTVRKGQRLRRDDPRVLKNPEWFALPARPLSSEGE